jgi:predicted DNA-binding WGR domain protein
MPDELRSPIKHHLVLHRIDPEQGIRRFYSLMIERDLFGTVRLVRNWGRIGTNGQELVAVFASEEEAGEALEGVARAKRRRGYRDKCVNFPEARLHLEVAPFLSCVLHPLSAG